MVVVGLLLYSWAWLVGITYGFYSSHGTAKLEIGNSVGLVHSYFISYVMANTQTLR